MDRMRSLWDSLKGEALEPSGEGSLSGQTVAQLRQALLKRGSELLAMFEGNSRHGWLQEYRNALADCISNYRQIEKLRPEYKKQNIVLESYFQRSKLMDYMEQMISFAQAEPRPADTAEKLAVKGYSNYLFVIKCTMKDMEEALNCYVPTESDAELTARTFLKLESAGQPLLEEWQLLRGRINQVFKTSPTNKREYTQRMQELDEIEVAFRRSHGAVTAFLRDKQAAMLERMERMEAEIRLGEELCLMLRQLFTEALFERFDPDATEDWDQDIQQIKQGHRELAEQMQLVLDRFPRR